jgi:hypothetical protein
MNPARELALKTMQITKQSARFDFLHVAGVPAPVPVVPGALPDHARVLFPALLTGAVQVDLVVCWTIGDFRASLPCSSYYDSASPWYNVFYGAYGIRSYKPDGIFYGYDRHGNPDFDEMLAVPELDYNVLTAGQLGCPKEKQIFRVLAKQTGKDGRWDHGRITAQVPSGLHHPRDSKNANPLWYSIFGFPDPSLSAGHESYEAVEMHGEIFFRRITEVREPKLTLVWGAMCPHTTDGRTLLAGLIAELKALYP